MTTQTITGVLAGQRVRAGQSVRTGQRVRAVSTSLVADVTLTTEGRVSGPGPAGGFRVAGRVVEGSSSTDADRWIMTLEVLDD